MTVHRHLIGVALLLGSSFLLVGCQRSSVDTQQYTQLETVDVQTADIAHVVEGGIEIERSGDGRMAFIVQEEGSITELTWNADGTRLGWVTRYGDIAEKDVYYTINWANTNDFSSETVYLSREEPYAISFAPIGGYMAFIENEAVYSLQIENGVVYKVYDQINRDQYAWSPEFAAVVVRGVTDTRYIEIEEGRPVSSIEVFEQPLDGLAFLDSNTIIGVQQNEKIARLQSIDLRTSESEALHEWEYAYSFLDETDPEEAESDDSELLEQDEAPEITDEMRMHRFSTIVNAAGEYIIEEYQLVGSNPSVLYLYTSKLQREKVLSKAHILGWSSKQSILVESSADAVIRRVTVDTTDLIDLYESVDIYAVMNETL